MSKWIMERNQNKYITERNIFNYEITKYYDIITKYNDRMLKLFNTSLKLQSTFAQGNFSGRNWILVLMKMNENCLKNSGKTCI